MKSEQIMLHHALEAELYRLRLLRDLNDPEYLPEKEDALLDRMESVWYRLSGEDRRVLEAERAAREAGEAFLATREPGAPTRDVEEDLRVRGGLPPRIAIPVNGCI